MTRIDNNEKIERYEVTDREIYKKYGRLSEATQAQMDLEKNNDSKI